MSRQGNGGNRLLAINNYFYRRGGAEAVFFDHMKMFSDIGWDVVPFAMQHEDNEASPWSEYFVSEIEYGRRTNLLRKVVQAAPAARRTPLIPLPSSISQNPCCSDFPSGRSGRAANSTGW